MMQSGANLLCMRRKRTEIRLDVTARQKMVGVSEGRVGGVPGREQTSPIGTNLRMVESGPGTRAAARRCPHKRGLKGQGDRADQGTRKGCPYYTRKRLSSRIMYSRGGACPRPGISPAPPKVRAYGECLYYTPQESLTPLRIE